MCFRCLSLWCFVFLRTSSSRNGGFLNRGKKRNHVKFVLARRHKPVFYFIFPLLISSPFSLFHAASPTAIPPPSLLHNPVHQPVGIRCRRRRRVFTSPSLRIDDTTRLFFFFLNSASARRRLRCAFTIKAGAAHLPIHL